MVETVDIQQDKGSRENGARWVDCKTMMGILGVSKSTLYRKIDLDEVESTKIGNARLFRVSGVVGGECQTYDMPEIDTVDTAGVEIDTAGIGVDSIGVDKGSDVPYDAKYVGKLEEEITYLRSRLEKLEDELSETKQRSDTIVLKFTENLEQRKLIGNGNRPFWKFW